MFQPVGARALLRESPPARGGQGSVLGSSDMA